MRFVQSVMEGVLNLMNDLERILWYSHITKCSPKADCPECKKKDK